MSSIFLKKNLLLALEYKEISHLLGLLNFIEESNLCDRFIITIISPSIQAFLTMITNDEKLLTYLIMIILSIKVSGPTILPNL